MTENSRTVFKVKGEDLLKKVKALLHETNIRRIIIRGDTGNPYVEIPVAVGVGAAILAPVLAAVGALAALVTNCTIEIVRKENDCCCSCEGQEDPPESCV